MHPKHLLLSVKVWFIINIRHSRDSHINIRKTRYISSSYHWFFSFFLATPNYSTLPKEAHWNNEWLKKYMEGLFFYWLVLLLCHISRFFLYIHWEQALFSNTEKASFCENPLKPNCRTWSNYRDGEAVLSSHWKWGLYTEAVIKNNRIPIFTPDITGKTSS